MNHPLPIWLCSVVTYWAVSLDFETTLSSSQCSAHLHKTEYQCPRPCPPKPITHKWDKDVSNPAHKSQLHVQHMQLRQWCSLSLPTLRQKNPVHCVLIPNRSSLKKQYSRLSPPAYLCSHPCALACAGFSDVLVPALPQVRVRLYLAVSPAEIHRRQKLNLSCLSL